MNLLWRMLLVGLGALRRSPLQLLEESVLPLRVLPNDLDLNVHMNNGRYLSLMDLGRMDLVLRNGLFKVAFRNKWKWLAGSATVRFRRPLGPLARYRIRTRLVCWDQKWFYVEQLFEKDGHVTTKAFVKFLFWDKDRAVIPQTVVEQITPEISSPPMPEPLRNWLSAESYA
jgi:acyl-CoA thioesterase FadM